MSLTSKIIRGHIQNFPAISGSATGSINGHGSITPLSNINAVSSAPGQIVVTWTGGVGSNVQYSYSLSNGIIASSRGTNPTTLTLTRTDPLTTTVTVTATPFGNPFASVSGTSSPINVGAGVGTGIKAPTMPTVPTVPNPILNPTPVPPLPTAPTAPTAPAAPAAPAAPTVPPTPITNVKTSNVSVNGFTASWSGGTGQGVTTTFTINGQPASPTNGTTSPATFNVTSPNPSAFVITATNSTGTVSSQVVNVVPVVQNGLILNMYNNGDVAGPAGFSADFQQHTLQYFYQNPVVATGITTNFTNDYTRGASPYARYFTGMYGITAQGIFTPNVSGTWTFYLIGDDFMWMYLGDNARNPTVNNYSFKTTDYHTELSYPVNLTAGTQYPILLLWGQSRGGTNYGFRFTDPNGKAYTDTSGFTTSQPINPTYT